MSGVLRDLFRCNLLLLISSLPASTYFFSLPIRGFMHATRREYVVIGRRHYLPALMFSAVLMALYSGPRHGIDLPRQVQMMKNDFFEGLTPCTRPSRIHRHFAVTPWYPERENGCSWCPKGQGGTNIQASWLPCAYAGGSSIRLPSFWMSWPGQGKHLPFHVSVCEVTGGFRRSRYPH